LNCYNNDGSTHLDFVAFFIKDVKRKFIERQTKEHHGRNIGSVIKSSCDFINELDFISYSLCKILLVDCMTKRYLKSYVSTAILLFACDSLATKVLGDNITKSKFDTIHVALFMELLQESIVKYFGFNKFILFLEFGKFLFMRI